MIMDKLITSGFNYNIIDLIIAHKIAKKKKNNNNKHLAIEKYSQTCIKRSPLG